MRRGRAPPATARRSRSLVAALSRAATQTSPFRCKNSTSGRTGAKIESRRAIFSPWESPNKQDGIPSGVLACLFFFTHIQRDSNNQMQHSGGLLLDSVGPESTPLPPPVSDLGHYITATQFCKCAVSHLPFPVKKQKWNRFHLTNPFRCIIILPLALGQNQTMEESL